MSVDLTGHSLHIQFGKVRFDIGWYSGEEFRLLSVVILEVFNNWITVLEVRLVKFTISLSIG